MASYRAALLLCCILLSSITSGPFHSVTVHASHDATTMGMPRLRSGAPTKATSTQPNLVVRPLAAIGGQIAGIASSGTLIYLAQANGLTILDATNPEHIMRLSRRAVSLDEPVRSVHVAGEMAYLTTHSRITAVNVADPSNPIVRASIPTVGGIQAIEIQGNTMYMAISNTLQLFDLSSPAQPIPRGSYRLRGYPSDIEIVKNLAYVTTNVAEDLSPGGLEIVDVSNPARPVRRGFYAREGANRVAVSGTSAYIASNFAVPDQSELTIVDVHDPAHPKLRATIPAPGAGEGIQVINNRTYMVGESGLTVVDVANPSKPVIRSTVPGAAHTLTAVAGRLDLVTDYGVLVTDLANPDRPTPLGTYTSPTKYPSALQIAGDTAYVVNQYTDIQIVDIHDATQPAVRATIPISLPADIQVVDQLAYVTKLRPFSDSELAIIDISDPARPLTLGAVPIGYGPGQVQVIGQTAYVSFFPYKQFGPGGFRTVDVHDPTNPHVQGTYIPSPLGEVGDFQVVGSYAYLASWSDGFQILDISDPISPTLRGSLAPGTSVNAVAVVGTHAYIVYNDGATPTLAVIDVSNPDQPALQTSLALPATSAYSTDLEVAGTFAYVSYGGYNGPGGVVIVDVHDSAQLALRSFYRASSIESLHVIDDRLYMTSGWAGFQVAQLLELNQQAWLPFALNQAAR